MGHLVMSIFYPIILIICINTSFTMPQLDKEGSSSTADLDFQEVLTQAPSPAPIPSPFRAASSSSLMKLKWKWSPFPVTHIYLHNAYGATVKVHADAIFLDYGAHVLQDGEVVEIVFQPLPFLLMSFVHCTFDAGNQFADGLVYNYFYEWPRCYKHCHWFIMQDKIHGQDSDGTFGAEIRWRGHPTH